MSNKKYDPVDYWNERDYPNSASSADTVKHRRYVFSHVLGCDTILDFGSGVGRMLPCYITTKHVACYDISDNYRDQLVKASRDFNFDFTFLVEKEIKRLPYPDDHFDAVVCVSVLMHQRPEHVSGIMKELARVSKKVIAISWTDPSMAITKIKPGTYCFNHDYKAIVKSIDCEMMNYTIGKVCNGKAFQAYFVYRKA